MLSPQAVERAERRQAMNRQVERIRVVDIVSLGSNRPIDEENARRIAASIR